MQTEDNILEIALELAASEPAHRPEFYRLLLESTIFILGSSGQLTEGDEALITLKANTPIEVVNWVRPDGSSVIPFFSSLRTLQLAITSDEKYLALPARTFFEITRGAELILNPRSEFGKEFTSAEVEALLTEGVNKVATPMVAEKATEILLGQPADYPKAMVASLTTLLGKHSNVRAAYLAQIYNRSHDEKPHLIVGIEADGDFENVVHEAGTVAADTAPAGEPVDLMRITRGESGIGKYFLEKVKPFYEREGSNDVSVVSNASAKRAPLKGWLWRMLLRGKSD